MNYVQHARELLAKKVNIESDLLDLYTLLVFTTGIGTELIHVHDAWAIWKAKTDPTHKSLVSFSDLSIEKQELDRKFMEAIRETAAAIATN